MRHLKATAFLALTIALTAAVGKCGDKYKYAEEKDFFIKNNDTVVFLGDSITQQKLYTTYIEAYTLTRFPDYNLTFRNTGWGGDTAWLRKRWKTDEKKLFSATGQLLEDMVTEAVHKGLERDVLPLNPTAVTVNFGMNDHSYQAFRPDIFRAYKRSQEELVHTLKKNGARVALLTPQPIEDMKKEPEDDPRNISLRKFSDGLKDVAAAEGAVYVDQFDPYMDVISKRTEGQKKTIGEGDAVHPGPCGHTVMAWAVLKGLNAPALVSSAVIDTSVKWYNFFKKQVETSNCTVSNISYKDGILSFDRLDNALPMPIDKRAVNALKLVKITCDLNRYPLRVEGLPDGEYHVFIDGKSVVKITSKNSVACTNLAKVATPASEQADRILSLVFKKNNVYFNRWRKVQLKTGDAARLAELDKQIVDMEKQINELRRPVTHHFEIKPL
ncbi:MAG: SGNH/GDSL hydrolase family protein [Kiritimatiellia bacterium]